MSPLEKKLRDSRLGLDLPVDQSPILRFTENMFLPPLIKIWLVLMNDDTPRML